MTLSAKLPPQVHTSLLRRILNEIHELTANNQKSLAVFDLDSTLFDVSPRLQQILLDFANNPDNERRFPESTKILKTIRMQRSDWGIRQALIRAGLDQHSTDFHHAVRTHWMESFFSGHYLQFDQPFAGATEFVNQAATLGADVVYLSGRDRPNMESGTRDVLKKWGFPLEGTSRGQLALKPQKGMDDAEFKRDWFLELAEEAYQKIWFFENEPLNVNLIRQHLPAIEIVFFESTHAGKAEPPSDLPKILHFLLDED